MPPDRDRVIVADGSGLAPRPAWGVAERADFLATVELFRPLLPGTIREVATRFRPRRVARGGFVFLEGQPARTLNLLAEGRVKVVRETENGREVILRLIDPGELFGAAGGWGELAYPASAVALADALVLQLPAGELADLVRAAPDFGLALIRELGARLREVESRVRDLQTERVERRIARTLVRLAGKTGREGEAGAELELPLTRQNLAELAGTTLSTASRTLSAWDAQGIIVAGRERVVIRRPHMLLAIAEELLPDEQPAPDIEG